VLPANEHSLSFRVSARVIALPLLPLGMKLSLCVLINVLQPVVRIMWRQCMIIQASEDKLSRNPLGPSPSKTDAASATRFQIETLYANLGLTGHPNGVRRGRVSSEKRRSERDP